MNYKNVIIGAIFYVMVKSIERSFNLPAYSLLIPSVVIVIISIILYEKKIKKRHEK
ncbi:MAG: hypothetical protein U9N10_00475 [Bacillota bacterium]|nr:hypothetical protein [Bacillota bacterium]